MASRPSNFVLQCFLGSSTAAQALTGTAGTCFHLLAHGGCAAALFSIVQSIANGDTAGCILKAKMIDVAACIKTSNQDSNQLYTASACFLEQRIAVVHESYILAANPFVYDT